ncbi:hypothetical protein D3C87_1773200 [compost metagenome]
MRRCEQRTQINKHPDLPPRVVEPVLFVVEWLNARGIQRAVVCFFQGKDLREFFTQRHQIFIAVQ